MINKAVQFIKSGKVVVFPTETVYGIGADATNNEACLKIFQFKNRPAINPLIVHVASIEQAKEIGEFNDLAIKIAEKFWSGPLSIVVPLKKNVNIASSVTAGLNTIAIRIPSYPLALELIRQSGKPIAAPSANPSNYISPTNTEHVTKHFKDNEEIFILAPEIYQSEYGLESTIIDTTTATPTILREGFITAEVLEKTLGMEILKASEKSTIKAPGMLAKHYSPKVPIRLNATNLEDKEIGLNFGNSNLTGRFLLNLSPKGDLIEAAANLYAYLRIFDDYAASHDIEYIAVAPVPSTNIGAAINDRLKRAAKL
ncbi:MAG: L-threonylcarbamoyladenylate synthase [Rickettsia endosymbiont of Ixodes persulcatus]|nr:L-threonylcarbamoyladenylate synthase [Rickettsia endosymbiont of Ixodes persulcatus]MCZ6901554.1 L-threonylcarbamoyladenylate synthase [Rickettsia endosymbiont of Ixodes persulcatus]MCZ6903020.1 L-threonylcarbamoyladenylate synthase [Rickettsia endosymbiont of Ixodes persulcatus]MCZ6908603.1 L-threonylcarbamoyladenylate synthase [Rickettsia endosymbiont of Ixodes persulcatus]MCZ6909957.1 L-threonylcarbamoyladenylate synthase [Rickettsia endosymbiont of Ixodes persulcatus]